jgi:hypothetical protein
LGQPRTTDFYRCSRPVQDRFVAATQRTAPPAPLLFRSAPRTTAWSLLAASGVVVLVATLFLVMGWGNVASPFALHGRRMLAIDALLFSIAAYCFVHATVILRALEALPYRAGTYVFPASVIDASGPVLRVWPVSEMETTERLPQPALGMRMRDGERLVIPASSASEVERVDAALASLRPELTRALAEDDADMLAELDPLHNTRVSSPISSTVAMRRFSPLWRRFDWVLAAAIGVVLALGLGSVRNASSDERMYRVVLAAGTIPAYKQYLTHGGKHSDEVRDVLLARAELYDAQREGTLGALQEFARTHPSSKIGPEIDAAMRRLLLIELDKTKAIGTVSALDEFVRKYPDNHLGPELKAARHSVYAQALATWKKKVHTDAATSAFVERLLASAEKVGANCEVRFRYKVAQSLADVDKRIPKHAYYPGPEALPSHYLTADAMRPREQRVAQAVVEGFAAAFPTDVLSVHAGEPLAAGDPAPAGVAALIVDYTAEWSNSTTASEHPRTIFAGIRFDFDPRFVLPEGAPLQLPLKSWRGPELWKIKGGGGMAPEDYHRRIYDMMIDRAFDELQRRLADAFFH